MIDSCGPNKPFADQIVGYHAWRIQNDYSRRGSPSNLVKLYVPGGSTTLALVFHLNAAVRQSSSSNAGVTLQLYGPGTFRVTHVLMHMNEVMDAGATLTVTGAPCVYNAENSGSIVQWPGSRESDYGYVSPSAGSVADLSVAKFGRAPDITCEPDFSVELAKWPSPDDDGHMGVKCSGLSGDFEGVPDPIPPAPPTHKWIFNFLGSNQWSPDRIVGFSAWHLKDETTPKGSPSNLVHLFIPGGETTLGLVFDLDDGVRQGSVNTGVTLQLDGPGAYRVVYVHMAFYSTPSGTTDCQVAHAWNVYQGCPGIEVGSGSFSPSDSSVTLVSKRSGVFGRSPDITCKPRSGVQLVQWPKKFPIEYELDGWVRPDGLQCMRQSGSRWNDASDGVFWKV